MPLQAKMRLGSRLASSLSRVASFPKRSPFLFNLALSTVNPVTADLITQTQLEGTAFKDLDWRRNGAFAAFGFFYLGGIQWLVHVTLYQRWFPSMARFAAHPSLVIKFRDKGGLVDTAKQIAFDVFVHLPMMYLPTFYCVKELARFSAPPSSFEHDAHGSLAACVAAGLEKYQQNWLEDFKAIVLVWGPSNCITFGAVPIFLRLPTRNLVSFIWNSCLSFTRGSQ